MDPQCNATSGLGARTVQHHPLLTSEPLSKHAWQTGVERLSLIPGSRSFDDVEQMEGTEGTAHQVVKHLTEGIEVYDFVLIDCPPSLGQLTQTALAAASEVLMPIQCEYFAMEGLTQMIELIRDVMRSRPGQLEFGGILLTMYDESLELTREVDLEVRDFFGEIVFDSVVPRDVNVTEAPSHGQCVLEYAPRSRGTRAYIELCMEVLERD